MANTETHTKEKTLVETSLPKLWKVIFLNDNVTPMEHVVDLLMNIFKHTERSATDVTLEIHNTGSGVAGVYNHEIAEQKALESTTLSRSRGFPLKIQIESEE
jgi:ATP-dependent Clp protease adaptor protein ClpS